MHFWERAMKPSAIAIALVLLAGCQTSSMQDGRQWSRVKCSGASDWTACWRQAEQICPNGFDMANKEEDRSALKREVDIACKR
jgi:hypothetical protein